MDRKHLAETVSRRDADAEPPRMGSRRVSARCLWFMSVVNNGFGYIHWHRDMNCESPPKTRREPIHGGSNPASMRDTVFGSDSQSMPLILCGTVVECGLFIYFTSKKLNHTFHLLRYKSPFGINRMNIISGGPVIG